MTYFIVNNPFIQAPSFSYLLLFLLKACLFYPLLFWGCFRHLAQRSVPITFYLLMSAIFIFFPPNLFGNDLIIVCLMEIAVYYLANPTGERLSTIVSQLGASMMVYYFSSLVCLLLSRVVLARAPQFGSILYLFLVPLIYLFALLVIKVVRPLYHRYFTRVNNRHPVAEWVISALFIPLSYFFYVVQMALPNFAHLLGVSPASGNFWAFGLTWAYFLLVLYLTAHWGHFLFSQDQVAYTNQQLTNLTNYTSELEVMYDDLRRFRHDYKNILFSLQSALDSNNLDYAKDALAKLTDSTDNIVNLPTNVFGAMQNIADGGVKSIVYAKLSAAMKDGIKTSLEVVKPIKLTKTMRELDAIRVISILLDNAIAAAKQSPAKKISLSLFENDSAQFIIVGNSTKEEQVNLTRLAETEHAVQIGTSHHLGLRNLLIILGHYPHAVNDRQANKHWLEQRIVIPKEK